jgi:hypothetical protein
MANFLIWLCTVDIAQGQQFQEFLKNGTNGHDPDQKVFVHGGFDEVDAVTPIRPALHIRPVGWRKWRGFEEVIDATSQ